MAPLSNADGTPYNLDDCGGFNQFNPNNPIHELFDLWDSTTIQRYGSPIYYYEVFIPKSEIDPLYREARGKIYSTQPITLYANYDPQLSQYYQNSFGVDSLTQQVFELNYQDVLQRIGHPPVDGSRLHTPHLGEDWMIVQRGLGEFKMWGAVRLLLFCSKFQESTTTSDGRVTETKPDYTIE